MRKIIFVIVVFTTCLLYVPMFSQIDSEPEALGLPGDNLNLYAVLDVFQKSPTLEEFERVLNNRDSNINNLDLNNDGTTDYIEVNSDKQGNSFSVVLRVAINDVQYQDVAVIEGYKNYKGKVIVQIIGDEDLYGKDFIVEPSFSETQNPGYVGSRKVVVVNNPTYYMNDWPIIVTLFSPTFSVYISPWHWGFYPSYWSPWRPIYYHVYWGFHSHYYKNHFYHRVGYIRYPIHYSHYYKTRKSSPIVIQHRLEGRYNSVYDGRTYKRPVEPIRRTATSNTARKQSASSSNRQSTPREAPSTTRQSTRQEAPSTTRQSTPREAPSTTRQSTRQEMPSTGRSGTRPVAPTASRPESRPPTNRSDKSGRRNN